MEECPVCLNRKFENFIDFGRIPVSDQYLKNSSESPKQIDLSFEYCPTCAFIRQKGIQDYNYREDSRRTSHTQMIYCQNIAENLKKIDRGLIVDVGCNDGTFLDLLRNKGLENLLGIEPSVDCAKLCSLKGHRVENIYFENGGAQTLRKKYGAASAIIYRHILEHVRSPFDFLLEARELLNKKGKLFIELPDSNNIIDNLNAHELLDQHINYFTPQNLKYIVNRAGFRIEKILIQPYMGTDAILLFASKENGEKIRDSNFFSERCANFSSKWEKLSGRIREKIKTLKFPLTGLGASHPQSRFLIFSGVGRYINRLIDDDPYKIGKYICVPNPVQIISTEQFINHPKGTLLHTAFGHDEWLKRIINSLNGEYNVFKLSKRLKEIKLK